MPCSGEVTKCSICWERHNFSDTWHKVWAPPDTIQVRKCWKPLLRTKCGHCTCLVLPMGLCNVAPKSRHLWILNSRDVWTFSRNFIVNMHNLQWNWGCTSFPYRHCSFENTIGAFVCFQENSPLWPKNTRSWDNWIEKLICGSMRRMSKSCSHARGPYRCQRCAEFCGLVQFSANLLMDTLKVLLSVHR